MLHLLASLLLSTTPATTPPPTTTTTPPAVGVDVEHWNAAFAAFAAHEAAHPPTQPTYTTVRVQRVLDVDVHAPIERVFAAFSNVGFHYQRHALLRGATTWALLPRDDVGPGVVERRFTAIEDVPLLPGVSLPVATYARVLVDEARHRFTTESWTEPSTITRQVWTFTEHDGVVHVHETITFESSAALMATVVEGGVSAHTAMFVALKRDLEAGVL